MIIWLASYPKSGNTWLRSIVASLLYSKDGIFKFELLKKIDQFPIKKYFEDFTSDFSNIHEIKKYWILSQEKINLKNDVQFFKTHHINCKINEFNFTNKNNTLAIIYIVRDPRNLIYSIANHFNKSVEEAKNFLTTPQFIGGRKIEGGIKKTPDTPALLGTWNEHYKSWTYQNENLLLLKYENLIENTEQEIIKIINFIQKFQTLKISKQKIQNIIKSTSFNNLQKMEKDGDFLENSFDIKLNKKNNFFFLGPKNNWVGKLPSQIQNELENKFKNEMEELCYL